VHHRAAAMRELSVWLEDKVFRHQRFHTNSTFLAQHRTFKMGSTVIINSMSQWRQLLSSSSVVIVDCKINLLPGTPTQAATMPASRHPVLTEPFLQFTQTGAGPAR
jgi:hypothetical protein